MTHPSRLDLPVLIELREVEKTYQTADGPLTSLRAVSFDVREGEFLSIVGPSGCGKSTLLKILAGLLPLSGGEARINGRRVDGPQDGVGMVFQSPVLLAWRDVLGNVMLQIEIRGLEWEPYRRRALELLQVVGLAGFERKRAWELSGGMQQRVAICRALLLNPSLLLLDEPFGALDVLTREKMGFELQKIWSASKTTVLLVTHSITEAVLLSDTIIVMTARPGKAKAVIAVDLPRPRDVKTLKDPRFVELAAAVRDNIEAQWLD